MTEQHVQHGYTGQRDDPYLRQDGEDGVRFHHATIELLISGIFYLIFLDHG